MAYEDLLPEDGKPKKKVPSALAAADNVLTAKGNVFTRAQYEQLQQKGLNFKSMKEAGDWADIAGKHFIPARDNTTAINPVAPVNQSLQALHNSQKAVAINQAVREKDAYYNPEVKNIKSGDKMMDFLYNHQGLMDVPILGNIIKNKAYEVAQHSGADAIIDPAKIPTKGHYSGSGSENDGPKLLDVYFGKQSLPVSAYKPTSDYMPFLPSYSLKTQANLKRMQSDGNMSNIIRNIVADSNDGKTNPLEYDYKTPLYVKNNENSELSNLLGVDLGGHKTGIGYDKEKNLPYVSISDAWDFEPKAYAKKWENAKGDDKSQADLSYIESSLMHKAGKPFKVYDRFYFDPKTMQYIPDEKLNKK